MHHFNTQRLFVVIIALRRSWFHQHLWLLLNLVSCHIELPKYFSLIVCRRVLPAANVSLKEKYKYESMSSYRFFWRHVQHILLHPRKIFRFHYVAF